MDLLKSFESFIKTENLFQPKDKLIIAVSGGVDSIVLCELCHQAGFDFRIAHCNFQLRGEESDKDEQFVKSLSNKYGVEVFVKSFETEKYALKNRIGIQEAARSLRYEWFKELVNSQWSMASSEPAIGSPQSAIANLKSEIGNPQFKIRNPQALLLLTAHHANDNIETLLMNFFRGTGITGLRGILTKQENIVRPLLFATKQELINFAKENNLAFAEDSSNSSDKYTRNYFRNQLIPSIQKVYPKVEDNLNRNLQRFKEIEMLYQQSVTNYKKKLLEYKGEEIHIPVLKLLKSKPLFTLVYEIIKDFNFTSHQTGEAINLLSSETGKYLQSSSHKIIRNRNWLIITPNNTSLAQNILIGEKDNVVQFSNGQLTIKKGSALNHQLSTSDNSATLDADEIEFPLLLRKWKQGDYFYPLGMNKKKKLSRFFIDQKMSSIEKENTWVIEMNKKIIWIVGKRIDNRFKITAKTQNVLLFNRL